MLRHRHSPLNKPNYHSWPPHSTLLAFPGRKRQCIFVHPSGCLLNLIKVTKKHVCDNVSCFYPLSRDFIIYLSNLLSHLSQSFGRSKAVTPEKLNQTHLAICIFRGRTALQLLDTYSNNKNSLHCLHAGYNQQVTTL